jgi:hypothetical protein
MVPFDEWLTYNFEIDREHLYFRVSLCLLLRHEIILGNTFGAHRCPQTPEVLMVRPATGE